MKYQTMKLTINGGLKMRTGNNEQIVKVRFGCYAEIENRGKKHTIYSLTCSNKYVINMP